jgi:hypothetical protein
MSQKIFEKKKHSAQDASRHQKVQDVQKIESATNV